MFLTLHQKFANMDATLFPSRRRPSHGRSSTSLRACLSPPSHGPIAPARSGALRRAPARSVLVVSEFAPLAATARASRQSSVSSTVRRFPNQGQQTVVRRPHPKDPREAPPCPMLSHDRCRCRLGILLHLLLHTVCSYDPLRNIACEIDSRHASLAVFRAFAKNRPTQARRTNTLPAHLPCSYEASFTARSPALSRPPPAFGRCARRLSVLPRRPPAPRAFPWSRTRRADCLFFLRAVVGWISLAPAPASRAARPRRSFSRRRLAGGSCHHRDPSVPSRRGSLRGRRRRPEPRGAGRLSRASDGFFDRASSFPCRIGDPAFVRLLSRRSRIDARRAGRFRRSCTRTRGRGLVAALERERRTPGPSARSSRRGNIIFSPCKISGTRRELSFLFFTGRCPFSVRSHLARGSFSEILSRPIDRAR